MGKDIDMKQKKRKIKSLKFQLMKAARQRSNFKSMINQIEKQSIYFIKIIKITYPITLRKMHYP
jgi:hypothetical protein